MTLLKKNCFFIFKLYTITTSGQLAPKMFALQGSKFGGRNGQIGTLSDNSQRYKWHKTSLIRNMKFSPQHKVIGNHLIVVNNEKFSSIHLHTQANSHYKFSLLLARARMVNEITQTSSLQRATLKKYISIALLRNVEVRLKHVLQIFY